MSPGDILNSASGAKWKRLGVEKRAGVLAPLFSLYSKNGLGGGDLSSLKLLIDWASDSGNSIIQLLPLNEMGALNCPYDAVSSFALEASYLGLGPQLKKIYAKEIKDNPVEFRKFQEENSYWLEDFSLFKALQGKHNGLPWYEWEDKFKNRDIGALERFKNENILEINFQMWLQWQLYRKFKEVRAYAEREKILIKGDLPILVSRDSADVWAHPEFFKLDFAAGAPPDMYCAKGQRWGMPTYNWENIEADSYRYLKEKLKYAQNFYDILRIDHVVGLFRIWSIPFNEPLEFKGLNGFFDPRDENIWREHGRKILNVMLDNTDMLLCAEDLGIIPFVCTETLRELGIPGNDVQRWAKDWSYRHDFLNPDEYRALSVAMLSTHDTTSWPAWWENEAGTVDEELFIRKCSDHRQIDFNSIKDKLFDSRRSRHGRLRWLNDIDSVDKLVKGLSPKGTLPKEHLADFIDLYENTYREKEKLWKHLKLSGPMRDKCDERIVKQALNLTLESNAIFCINTIVDYLYLAGIFKGDPYQYRINTPGTISPKNWSLRLPLSLEELLKHKVTKEIRKMITASVRA